MGWAVFFGEADVSVNQMMRNILNNRSVKSIFITVLTVTLGMSACIGTQTKEIKLTDTPSPTEISFATSTVTPTLPPKPVPLSLSTPILLGNYTLLSPDDMRFDLDELFHRLETTHPNLYAKRPKADVDLERQRIYDELDQPMTMVSFYKKVAPLINSLGDYHTAVFLPSDTIIDVIAI